MPLRFLVTALAVAATALTLSPVPTAQAAYDTCGNSKADIVGTDRSEKFLLTPEKRVINAHGGNDVIETFGLRSEDGTDAIVCMGSGDDTLDTGEDGPEAAPVVYLDGGKGFDRATIYACYTPRVYLRNMERVTIVNCAD